MITLFEENERRFDSLGLGILKDALSAPVKEALNDEFAMTMEYPITGALYEKIKINRIIYCKTNPFDDSFQPFRICSITKPINGIVTVEAVHVSYDMNGFPIKPISGLNLQEILRKISYGEDDSKGNHTDYSLIHDLPFEFRSDIYIARSFKTTAPYNLRAILMGGDESLIKKYDAELKFDKYEVHLLQKRGKDRGAKIIYGKNMTDIKNVSDNSMLFNGVYPYYHSESTTQETVANTGEFKKAYIVGTKEFQDGWLSYSENGEPFHPVTNNPIQIATDGKYFDKVYCWNETIQRFEEKIYNQSVMLIKDIISPEWVSIDWSHFPTVVCKARKKGYFKKMTDEDWGSLKGVGDTVFEASILNSGITENIMLYFAEVIPSNGDSTNEEAEEIIHVELDEPIIWLDTLETRQMKHDNILSLDLTSEFDEEPTKQQLKNKAEEYISKNKIGSSKSNITVSFIDLSKTTEGKKYEKFDHIEIGDTVHIIYEDLGVNSTLRVISVEYDPILDRYNSIELGEKQDEMSSQSLQSGDNVSSLTNDVGYADVTTVNKLIANTVTAEWIEAVNAKLSKAAIGQLEVERINCKGIMEASQFTLDQLVAKMLIAENAQIAQTLEAGNVKVTGNINVKGGSISIQGTNAENQNETYFNVDRNGNVEANSVNITGGDLNIGDGNFVVSNEGIMQAKMAYIQGSIEANDGNIGGFKITDNSLYAESYSGRVYISPSYIELGTGSDDSPKFKVDDTGKLTADQAEFNNVTIKDGSINMNEKFEVESDGSVNIQKGTINIGYNSEELGIYSLDDRDTSSYKFIGTSDMVLYPEFDETSLSMLYRWKRSDTENIYYLDAYVENNKLCTSNSNSITVYVLYEGQFVPARSYEIDPKSFNVINPAMESKYNFRVDEYGNAKIVGYIEADYGKIANFDIQNNKLHVNDLGSSDSVWVSPGTEEYASIGGSDNVNNWCFTASNTFGVTKDGSIYASKGKIAGLNVNAYEMTFGEVGGQSYYVVYADSSKNYVLATSGIDAYRIKTLSYFDVRNNYACYTEIDYNGISTYENTSPGQHGSKYKLINKIERDDIPHIGLLFNINKNKGVTSPLKIIGLELTDAPATGEKFVDVGYGITNIVCAVACPKEALGYVKVRYDGRRLYYGCTTPKIDVLVMGY